MKLSENPKFIQLLKDHGLTLKEFLYYVDIVKKREKEKESSNDIETGSQQTYYDSSGKETTYLTPNPFVAPTKIALASMIHDVSGNLDEFLKKELKYKSTNDLNKALLPAQKDAVGLWIRNSRMK